MISKIYTNVPHKWPWFVFSQDICETTMYEPTIWKSALKWMFSVRHKINGKSVITDFKYFACCLLKDYRVAIDV